MTGRDALGSVVAVVASFFTIATASSEPERVRDCTSPSQAHDLLIEQKFVAPFRALAEAVREGQGDAVGVELCRLGELFVYDVTLLHHDGRVRHALVNAHSGALVSPGHPAK